MSVRRGPIIEEVDENYSVNNEEAASVPVVEEPDQDSKGQQRQRAPQQPSADARYHTHRSPHQRTRDLYGDMFGGGLFGANHFGGLSGNGLFGDMMGFHSMFADPFFSDMGSGMQFLTSPAFQADPNSTCSSFSSTYISRSSQNGKPTTYESTRTHNIGPGGIEEEQLTEKDSSTGRSKMEINRTLGDRTRKLKQQKIGAGPIETAEELVEDAEKFDREWRNTAQRSLIEPSRHFALEGPYSQESRGRLHQRTAQSGQKRAAPAPPQPSPPPATRRQPAKSHPPHPC